MNVLDSHGPVIAPAKPEAAAAIAQLLRADGLPADDFLPHLEHFLVAQDHGHIVGVVGLEMYSPFGLLRSLVVEKNRRESGLGSKLLAQVENHAQRQSIRELYLLTTTAEAFFAGRGFRQCPREEAPPSIQATEEFRSLCPSSARLMQRSLPTLGVHET